jgi:hypothetical protein
MSSRDWAVFRGIALKRLFGEGTVVSIRTARQKLGLLGIDKHEARKILKGLHRDGWLRIHRREGLLIRIAS